MVDGHQSESRSDLDIRCRCGAFRAKAAGISPATGYRVVCYCDDCQAFAERLGSAGTLDAQGGTDIIQMSPARLRIAAGRDRLACLRLTPRGPLRWYAACCNTPIGNTLATGRLPFLGLIDNTVETGGRPLDEVIGPVRRRIMAKFARGDLGGLEAHDGFVLAHVLLIGARILRWRLSGDHRRSPFFDPVTGEPVAAPEQAARSRP